jgi:hypothetical protein
MQAVMTRLLDRDAQSFFSRVCRLSLVNKQKILSEDSESESCFT